MIEATVAVAAMAMLFVVFGALRLADRGSGCDACGNGAAGCDACASGDADHAADAIEPRTGGNPS